MISNIKLLLRMLIKKEVQNLWPDWDCTNEVSKNVLPDDSSHTFDKRNLAKLCYDYSAYTIPFQPICDGRQWVFENGVKHRWKSIII